MPVTTRVRPKDNPADEYFGVGLSRAVLSGVELSKDQGSIVLVFTDGSYRHVEYVSLSEAAQKRQIVLARRLGQSIGDADEQAEIDWSKFLGKECVIDIVTEEYQGKTKHKLSFAGVYPLDHREPRVQEYLATPVGKRPAKPGSGARPTAAKAAAAPVNVDDV